MCKVLLSKSKLLRDVVFFVKNKNPPPNAAREKMWGFSGLQWGKTHKRGEKIYRIKIHPKYLARFGLKKTGRPADVF